MEKGNQLKLEKKDFYKLKDIVNKYDYRRYQRGGGKFVRRVEDEIIKSFIQYTRKKNTQFLDCPSGTGRSIPIIKEFSDKLICIDTSEEMISFSKRKFNDVEFQKSSADNLNLKDDSVNIFTSIRFLFHFNELDSFFSEANRVICLNGYYIFDVFNWSPRSFFNNKFIGGKTFNHNIYYIKKMCDKYNFEIIKSENCFFIPTYIATFLPNFFVTLVETVIKRLFNNKLGTKCFYLLKKN